jgi:putative transposase
MAMGRPKAALVLSLEQREQLGALSSSRSLPAGLVSRAKIILLSATGKTNQQIARQLGLTNATVGKWWRRFLEQDVSGLHDELRPGRPRPISDERVAQLVRKTLDTKPKDGTHWSIRQMARQTRLSKVYGASHLAGVRFGTAPAAALQALERSIFCRESTGYCRVVLESAGKCGGLVRG